MPHFFLSFPGFRQQLPPLRKAEHWDTELWRTCRLSGTFTCLCPLAGICICVPSPTPIFSFPLRVPGFDFYTCFSIKQVKSLKERYRERKNVRDRRKVPFERPFFDTLKAIDVSCHIDALVFDSLEGEGREGIGVFCPRSSVFLLFSGLFSCGLSQKRIWKTCPLEEHMSIFLHMCLLKSATLHAHVSTLLPEDYSLSRIPRF